MSGTGETIHSLTQSGEWAHRTPCGKRVLQRKLTSFKINKGPSKFTLGGPTYITLSSLDSTVQALAIRIHHLYGLKHHQNRFLHRRNQGAESLPYPSEY
jgi:hypothetical protein